MLSDVIPRDLVDLLDDFDIYGVIDFPGKRGCWRGFAVKRLDKVSN